MKVQIIGKVQRTEDGKLKIEGAMSPVLAAKEFAKHARSVGVVPNNAIQTHILRFWWQDERYLNVNEGLPMRAELTGYDTLALMFQYSNDRMLTVFQDRGVSLIPILLVFESESTSNECLAFTETFNSHKEEYVKLPTEIDWFERVQLAFKDCTPISLSELKGGHIA